MAISNSHYVVFPTLDGSPGILIGDGAPVAEVYDRNTRYVRRDAVAEYVSDGAGGWTQILDSGSSIAQHGATPCTGGGVDAHGATGAPSATGTAAGDAHTHNAGAFTGSQPTTASVAIYNGTGMTAAGQVMTSTDNQTIGVNELAGMFLATATANSLLYIVSNAAAVGAPVAITVWGTPVTDAGVYAVLRAPTPAGSSAVTGAPSATVAIPTSNHTHAGPANHTFTQPSTPILTHTVTP